MVCDLWGGVSGDFSAAISCSVKAAAKSFPPWLSDLGSVAVPAVASWFATRDCCRRTAPPIETGPAIVADDALARGRGRVSAEFEAKLLASL